MSAQHAIVVGGGPVGLTAALGLSRAGVDTTLITQAAPLPGTGAQARTAALFAPSLALLSNLGAWETLPQTTASLKGIRIVDDTGGPLRAPEVLFEAAEMGLAAFGANVPNTVLNDVLRAAAGSASATGRLIWLDGVSVEAVTPSASVVTVALQDGRTLSADLVIAADGRQSRCRAAAGIGVSQHAYDQVAVTASFAHQRPHRGISTEFHSAAGPCTVVPLPGQTSSLVWVERTPVARRLLALDDAAFTVALEARLKGLLGAISGLSPRGHFPLAWMKADRVAANRVMLVGEAAHVMPPIGAQGLNLGLRDVGCLLDCVSDAAACGGDIGGTATLAAYSGLRSRDIATRMTAVDGLNRSLLADLLPVTLARGLALHAVMALPPLRRRLMQLGMSPDGSLPRSMRRPASGTGHSVAV